MEFLVERAYVRRTGIRLGTGDNLANALVLADDPSYLIGAYGTWVSDTLKNATTGVTVATKHINLNGNWKLADVFLDVFVCGVLVDGVWHSYWLQPDGSIMRIEELDIPKMGAVEALPDFSGMTANVFQIPICATCRANPADGISHDADHRGFMPPYAMFECAGCAWDTPRDVFYQNGHRQIGRLRELAGEFYW